jgi:hypothetical protein
MFPIVFDVLFEIGVLNLREVAVRERIDASPDLRTAGRRGSRSATARDRDTVNRSAHSRT